jgi:hypothetical protein
MRPAIAAILLVAGVGPAAGCAAPVDLTRGVELDSVSTGWVDAGVVDGRNKLVPVISFTLKNVSDRKLPALQVNAVFRRANEQQGWGDGFRTVAGSGGLAPGATAPLNIEAQLGYTGLDSPGALLRHSQFMDARVDVFAKYGSAQWARLGEYPVARQLLGRQR